MEENKMKITNEKGEVRTGIAKMQNRSVVEWVNTSEIIPNALNPRKNDAIKSEDIQEIIRNNGWLIPLTAYKRGTMYVLISGHRRLYAAKQAKIKQIPIYLIDPPSSHQQEVQLIASAQSGQVDWTPLEWSKFSYERWLAWGKPTIKKFAKDLKLPGRTVDTYITVLDFFPLEEIEAGINNKVYAFSNLYDLVLWLKSVKKKHGELVNALTLEMIRRLMLEKYINRKTSRESIRKRDFLELVSSDDLKEFFLDKTKSLEELMAKYKVDINEKTFHAQMVSAGLARKAVKNLVPKNIEEAKKAFEILKQTEESLRAQLKHIETKYPDLKKNDLFDWK